MDNQEKQNKEQQILAAAEQEFLAKGYDGARTEFFKHSLLRSVHFLFFIPGFIFSISFSMTYHVLNDNPQMKPMEALRESNRLMKGHRVQYFCLLLSFIGWAFVGALLFGIGTLWVNTYMLTAQTVFYEELLKLDGTKDSFQRNQADEEQKEQERKNNSTHW